MRKKILIIEEEVGVAETLTGALSARGYHVVRAREAGAALAGFGTERPDLVIISLTLPDDEGRTICRSIRTRPLGALVPILFVGSGREEVRTVSDAIAAGADHYFRKPEGIPNLLAKVVSYIGPAGDEAVEDRTPDAAAERSGARTAEPGAEHPPRTAAPSGPPAAVPHSPAAPPQGAAESSQQPGAPPRQPAAPAQQPAGSSQQPPGVSQPAPAAPDSPRAPTPDTPAASADEHPTGGGPETGASGESALVEALRQVDPRNARPRPATSPNLEAQWAAVSRTLARRSATPPVPSFTPPPAPPPEAEPEEAEAEAAEPAPTDWEALDRLVQGEPAPATPVPGDSMEGRAAAAVLTGMLEPVPGPTSVPAGMINEETPPPDDPEIDAQLDTLMEADFGALAEELAVRDEPTVPREVEVDLDALGGEDGPGTDDADLLDAVADDGPLASESTQVDFVPGPLASPPALPPEVFDTPAPVAVQPEGTRPSPPDPEVPAPADPAPVTAEPQPRAPRSAEPAGPEPAPAVAEPVSEPASEPEPELAQPSLAPASEPVSEPALAQPASSPASEPELAQLASVEPPAGEPETATAPHTLAEAAPLPEPAGQPPASEAPESAAPDVLESAEPDVLESAEPDVPESAEPDVPESAEPHVPETAEPQIVEPAPAEPVPVAEQLGAADTSHAEGTPPTPDRPVPAPVTTAEPALADTAAPAVNIHADAPQGHALDATLDPPAPARARLPRFEPPPLRAAEPAVTLDGPSPFDQSPGVDGPGVGSRRDPAPREPAPREPAPRRASPPRAPAAPDRMERVAATLETGRAVELERRGMGEILAATSTAHLTGRVEIGSGGVLRRVFLESGRPVYADSSETDEDLSAWLVGEGIVPRTAVDEARLRADAEGLTPEVLLLEAGFVSSEMLYRALRGHVIERILGLFSLEAGDAIVISGGPSPVDPVDLGMHPGRLILDGIRRKYGRLRLFRKYGTPTLIPRPRAGAGPPAGLVLRAEEASILRLVDAERTVGEIARAAAVDDLEALAILAALTTIGLLERPAGRRGLGLPPLAEQAALHAGPPRTADDLPGFTDLVDARYADALYADYFQMLGVSRTATGADIRAAWERLKKQFDPHRVRRNGPLWHKVREIAAVLDDAYAILSDPRLRSAWAGEDSAAGRRDAGGEHG